MTEENEKKKEYLKQYEQTVRQMERSALKIHEMRLNRMCPSVINDGMPHGTAVSDLSDYVAMLDEEEQIYFKVRYQRVKLCREITVKIEQLASEDEKDVLMYRYIKLMKWEDICVKMGFSWKWIHALHSKALKNFVI